MGLLFEVVLQLLWELVGEALFELGFQGVAWVARRWLPRTIALTVIGLLCGAGWGGALRANGHVRLPKTFWVSLVIAAVTVVLIVRRLGRPDSEVDDGVLASPLRWPVQRLAGFASMSLAVALGVWAGFEL